MARNRIELSPIFKEILGNNNVYFQQPAQHMLKYPCIIYEKSAWNIDYADDSSYKNLCRYTITLIGKNPDNDDLVIKLLALPYCSFDRRFITDNLYHDVFELYF